MDRQTDMTKLIVGFRNFTDAFKITSVYWLSERAKDCKGVLYSLSERSRLTHVLTAVPSKMGDVCI